SACPRRGGPFDGRGGMVKEDRRWNGGSRSTIGYLRSSGATLAVAPAGRTRDRRRLHPCSRGMHTRNGQSALMTRRCYPLAAGACALLVAAAGVRLPYPDRPPPAHTGGFGEPTCQQCHFDAPLNDPGGALYVEGLPERYTPG